MFFYKLREGGIKDEIIEAVDKEYQKLQDEVNRIAGLSQEERRRYWRGVITTMKKIGKEKPKPREAFIR